MTNEIKRLDRNAPGREPGTGAVAGAVVIPVRYVTRQGLLFASPVSIAQEKSRIPGTAWRPDV